MAKHALNSTDSLQYPLDEGSQKYMGSLHAAGCKPRHSAGRASSAELTARYNWGVTAFNARQSDFYETHDRTEDARGE